MMFAFKGSFCGQGRISNDAKLRISVAVQHNRHIFVGTKPTKCQTKRNPCSPRSFMQRRRKRASLCVFQSKEILRALFSMTLYNLKQTKTQQTHAHTFRTQRPQRKRLKLVHGTRVMESSETKDKSNFPCKRQRALKEFSLL